MLEGLGSVIYGQCWVVPREARHASDNIAESSTNSSFTSLEGMLKFLCI